MRQALFTAAILITFLFSAERALSQIHPKPYETHTDTTVLDTTFEKPLFLEFTADWCKPCKQMHETTLQDTAVLSYLENNFRWIQVDVDSEAGRALKNAYAVNQYPTYIVVDMQNDLVLLRLIGYKPSEIFIDDLKFSIKDTEYDPE